MPQPIKIDLNKKSFPKQNTIQNFNIDAQGIRKTRNENPPHPWAGEDLSLKIDELDQTI